MPKVVTAQLTDKMVREVEEFMRAYVIDISLMKASEVAGLSLWEFINELQRRDITINISTDAVGESLGM